MAGPVGELAALVGAPEPALRLMLSVLLGYPAAWGLRALPALRSSRTATLSYLAACGLTIGLFNFGLDIYHSLAAVLFTYLSVLILGPGNASVIVNFVFHMGYLLTGYWFTGTESYDIKWTMPHCVLVLRLIGLVFDLSDGTKPDEKLSVTNRTTALRKRPSLLEIAAHVYFPASFLVGPQFSMVRLQKFVNGEFDKAGPPSCLSAGSKRALLGLGYLAVYQLGSIYFPDEYFLTQQYQETSFLRQHIILGIWGKIVLSKYISCWLLTEGACITFGLAYNGATESSKKSRWDGCRNVEIGIYEGCTRFGQYVDSFNINTNNWVAQYIYKRAAFLGNRQASQGLTLLFLALWHGFHSGYYITFFMEFAIMFMEKQMQTMLERSTLFTQVYSNKIFISVSFIILKLYVTVFMGYCLIPFTLLNFTKWWQVYKTLYFSGFILFFPWIFVYKPLLGLLIKSTNAKPASAKR